MMMMWGFMFSDVGLRYLFTLIHTYILHTALFTIPVGSARPNSLLHWPSNHWRPSDSWPGVGVRTTSNTSSGFVNPPLQHLSLSSLAWCKLPPHPPAPLPYHPHQYLILAISIKIEPCYLSQSQKKNNTQCNFHQGIRDHQMVQIFKLVRLSSQSKEWWEEQQN